MGMKALVMQRRLRPADRSAFARFPLVATRSSFSEGLLFSGFGVGTRFFTFTPLRPLMPPTEGCADA